ncbi:hypothetical protein [Aliiroseovarius sp.]|uniref:hypothetical protein n=1 Tax=Aliiroseovarius sp. TaxID=1872442 RepID=UPI003BAA5C31
MGELGVGLISFIAELVFEALLYLPLRLARWSDRSRERRIFLRLIALALLIWWNALPLWASSHPAVFSLPVAAAVFLASITALPTILIADYMRGSWGTLGLTLCLIVPTALSVTTYLFS